MSIATPPLNFAQLNTRVEEAARDLRVPALRVRRMLCTHIVSQMLPDAVAIKGGMGVKLRMGERGTRATADLDISTLRRGEEFEEVFTADVKPRPLHDPGLAQPQYVMHPYRVTLSFLGKEWGGLDVEVSDPEVEPHAHSRRQIDGELIELSDRFGFGALRPVELIELEYQIAQKIHALTDPDYSRAHDLVDLQLLWAADPDLDVAREYCVRTFDFRRAQKWPPLPVRTMDGWEPAYQLSREETEVGGDSLVLADIGSAREWFKQIITSLNEPAAT